MQLCVLGQGQVNLGQIHPQRCILVVLLSLVKSPGKTILISPTRLSGLACASNARTEDDYHFEHL